MERWDQDISRIYADSTGELNERRADLDGDGRTDIAYLLRSNVSTARDSTYAVVVAFGDGRDSLLGVFSWAEAMGSIGAGLLVGSPGELRHLGSDDPTLIVPDTAPHQTLTLVYFEKSAETWFWSEGTCYRVWTAD